MTVGVDRIAVASPDPLALDKAGVDEVGDDALRGTLRDANRLREVSHAHVLIARDAQQYLRVVADEAPGLLIKA